MIDDSVSLNFKSYVGKIHMYQPQISFSEI